MIIIPKEKPVVEKLNSYYLKLDRLLEHFRGELDSGCIYFYAPVAEAAIFFDDENLLNGFYEDQKRQEHGQKAIDRIFGKTSQISFSVSVYRIQPDRLYFWANLAKSKILYSDLSSEFADLAGLIKKMENEKLTGYIDVRLNPDGEQGLLFFHNGQLLGGSSSNGQGRVDRSGEYRDDLIKRSRDQGGTFNVHQTDLSAENLSNQAQPAQGQGAGGSTKAAAAAQGSRKKAQAATKAPSTSDSGRVVQMLQEMLGTLEKVARDSKKVRSDFDTLLNRKFMAKVDRYEFLDPFAGEFKYGKGKLSFTGDAPLAQLVEGVVACSRELASDLGMEKDFRKALGSWRKTYFDEIEAFQIDL